MKKPQLSATAIKLIAIIAMTIDHTAMTFVSPDSALYYVMRCIGRITAPIMCFFLVEGFRYTRSRKNYLLRLGIFAILSQPFYFPLVIQRMPTSTLDFLTHLNILFTLGISFLLLCLLDSPKRTKPANIILMALLFSLSQFCDWSYMIPIWTLVFYFCRGKKQLPLLFIIVSLFTLPLIFIKNYDSFWSFSYQFGAVLALIPLSFYNGKRGGSDTKLKKKISRWFFYVYYPVHMFLLLVLTCILEYGIIHLN